MRAGDRSRLIVETREREGERGRDLFALSLEKSRRRAMVQEEAAGELVSRLLDKKKSIRTKVSLV